MSEIERLARLKRFVSPRVGDLILAGEVDDPLKTHRREITVVFTDLRGSVAMRLAGRTARASTQLRHQLRTSMITFVSLFGLDFGALVGGGALLTEVVFGLQGVGKLTYDSLKALDLPVIMASVIYASFFVVAANFVVDMAYAVLDPRVRGR